MKVLCCTFTIPNVYMCMPPLSYTTMLVHCSTRVCMCTYLTTVAIEQHKCTYKIPSPFKKLLLSIIINGACARAIRKRDKNSQFYKWCLSSTLSPRAHVVVSSLPCVIARAKYLVLFDFLFLLSPLLHVLQRLLFRELTIGGIF